jgi:hypothetical protein
MAYRALTGQWQSEEQGIEGRLAVWKKRYIIGILQDFTLYFTPKVGRGNQPHLYNLAGKTLTDWGIVLPTNAGVDLHDPIMTRSIPQAEIEQFMRNKLNKIAFTRMMKSTILDVVKEKPQDNEMIVMSLRGYAEQHLLKETPEEATILVLENGLEEAKLTYGKASVQRQLLEKQERQQMLESWLQEGMIDGEESLELQAIPQEIARLTEKLADKNSLCAEGVADATAALRREKDAILDTLLVRKKLLKENPATLMATDLTFWGTMALLEHFDYLTKMTTTT